MHENEIRLAFRTTEGRTLPTRELANVTEQAANLGPQYVEAMGVQVNRQMAELERNAGA